MEGPSKLHIEQQHSENVSRFVDACRAGSETTVQETLAADPGLAIARDSEGSTALHAAAERGHSGIVRLLLQHGADPNARDTGDHATPLHFAAGGGHADTVRALLDGGANVHGQGDLHEAEVIGWATCIGRPEDIRWEAVALLVERGAKHHIFSAMATGDLDLVRRVVEDDPQALDRRMSRYEHARTPLHFAISRQRHDLVDLLIELGADLEGRDLSGRTPLEAAMMHGDAEAARQLRNAGAEVPRPGGTTDFTARMKALGQSVVKNVPMIQVLDVARSLEWYASIGFTEISRYEHEGLVNFGMVAFGKGQVMLTVGRSTRHHDVSLWFYTDEVDALYDALKARRIEAARTELDGASGTPGVEFEQDIENTFYGSRQFSIRDLDGYEIYFIGKAPTDRTSAAVS